MSDPYILFAQCNLWRSPNASTELGLYLNKAMSHYTYIDKDRAGFFLDYSANERMEDNYLKRMENVGIQVGSDGSVLHRPSEEERQKYKASYRRSQAQLGRQTTRGTDPAGTGQASQAYLRALGARHATGLPPRDSNNNGNRQSEGEPEKLPIPEFNQAKPAGFICALQEPPWIHKKV